MKNPKKPNEKSDLHFEASDDMQDLFKEIESVDATFEDEEEVLELEEVVEDAENDLKDLPDLDEGVSDFDELEPMLDESQEDESLFDEEEVTVELAPPKGKAEGVRREPLDEEIFKEDLEKAEEPKSEFRDLLSEEPRDQKEPQEDVLPDALKEEELEEFEDELEEPKPLETATWETDEELDAMLKGFDVKEDLLEKADRVEQEAPSALIHEEVAKEVISPKKLAEKPLESETDLVQDAAVAAVTTMVAQELTERRLEAFIEPAEEKAMEERPALFQPILEILEKRVQVMVQKAVEEQLPRIVRRVLQEEIERLRRSLG
ncbi:MAG: hypothetical protein WHS46_07950 [Desulfosoma sp.]